MDKLTTEKNYIRPEMANERMKMAHNLYQTVYICGASGSGKTSLVAAYLARSTYEYYAAEEIANIDIPQERLPGKNRIIVIDDMYLMDTVQKQENALPVIEALSRHPDVWLILISRSNVPAWLMSLYISDLFVVIDESYLVLRSKEMEQFFQNWNLTPLKETMARIEEISGGYPLALRFVAMRLQMIPASLQGTQRKRAEIEAIDQCTNDMYEYLITSVYEQWDEELTEFLMQLSVVGTFDLEMAQIITKKNNAGELIKRAREIGNFITVSTNAAGVKSYTFRQDFVDSMHKHLEEVCTKKKIDLLYQSAGNAYEIRGDIPSALAMYDKAGHEEGIVRLLIENARIHPGVGYYWQLRDYYMKLSEDYIAKSPVMISAMSMLQSILLNHEESERWYQVLVEFEKTHSGTLKKNARERLLYLDIALPHRGTKSLEKLFSSLGTLVRSGRQIIPEVSLTNNQPSLMNGGKDFSRWSKRDKELKASIGAIIEFVLGKYGKGMSNLAVAESMFEKGADQYEVYRLAIRGQMQAEGGGKLELTFVAVGLLAQLEMFAGQIEEALEILDTFRERIGERAPLLTTGVDTLRAQLLLRTDRTEEIREWMENSPNEETEFCTLERYRYITKARIYILLGKLGKAEKLLDRLIIYAEQRDRIYLHMEAMIILAIVRYRTGNPVWKNILQDAVEEAQEYHFVKVLAQEGSALLPLLQEGQISFQDEEFEESVFAMCRAQAEYYPNYLNTISTAAVPLSSKALQILRLQAKGYSIKQIAAEVGLSEAGVKYNNSETYRKLGVKSKTAAIAKAQDWNLI